MESHHKKDDKHDDALRSSFHIRLTIGNRSGDSGCPDSGRSSLNSDSDYRCQNVEHFHQPLSSKQNDTQHCTHQTIDFGASVGNQLAQAPKKTTKSFRFIEPQNHKSALFVNLSSSNSNQAINNPDQLHYQQQQHHYKSQELFISPDLNENKAAATVQSLWSHLSPTSSLSSSPTATNNTLSESASLDSYEVIDYDDNSNKNCIVKLVRNSVGAMSHSCNFISWVSATKPRSSSVSPSASKDTNSTKDLTTSTTTTTSSSSSTTGDHGRHHDHNGAPIHQARRASSSDGLNQTLEENPLLARSASGNHLAIMDSVETVCGDQFPTSPFKTPMDIGPLEVDIDVSPSPSDDIPSVFSAESDVLQIDMEQLKIDQEILDLQQEAQYWEQKVEDLERRQFADDVPRTLVENFIKHRKELRELEFQIHELNLSNQYFGTQSSYADSDHEQSYFDHKLINDYHELGRTDLMSPRAASKFGSRIKPGQENTADILNAVPPSGSLQHRQYLNKASSGTDTSEYSQMPSFQQHSHRLSGRKSVAPNRTRRRDGQIYSHVYSQVDGGNTDRLPVPDRGMRPAPVRPNHFKDEFRSPKAVIAQDSSSTASSGSPQ